MTEAIYIRKVAVLGAGVMGAQIAAHCINAGFATLLFDLEATTKPHNTLVEKAIAHLTKLKPSPLATAQSAALLKACNYADNIQELTSCDLIIEAIAERLDWKSALYQRIAPYLADNTILVTNTSGLSINQLAKCLPEKHRERFCGVHFFNPPRYMHLAELTPAAMSSAHLLDQLETWLTRYLGKGVVRAKDTPNFIANRIGVFSLLITLYHAEQFGLGLDEVDALTGPLIGRPKSATLRTIDVVGLDTMQHVVMTMQSQLLEDPWHSLFHLPAWIGDLIQKGDLGQKTGQGIYRKQGKTIEVYDISRKTYRPINKQAVNDEISKILKLSDPKQRMRELTQHRHPQAQFLSACLRDLFHYCAFHLQEIADTVRDIDLAMRWGFGWQFGPFESWQAAGVDLVRLLIDKAIQNNETFSQAKLPSWLTEQTEFYSAAGAFSPTSTSFKGTSELAVYQRQIFPENIGVGASKYKADVVFENEGVRLITLVDDIFVVNFKSKANTIDFAVLDGLQQALLLATERAQGLIVYQPDANNFSSGADLRTVTSLIQAKKMTELEAMIMQFQQLAMNFKYAVIPTVAALRGRALGGGCELLLHCSAIVAAFESYPGLVEAGVGLIPAGGGCKEMALRAALAVEPHMELMTRIRPYFEQIATAVVAGSAPEALQRGYLMPKDSWVMHTNEVLSVAMAQVKALQTANYLPPIPQQFRVAGREGHAQLEMGLTNWLEGGYISQHDYFLANQLAFVLCGGDVNQGTLVDEAWMLQLEKSAFLTLAAHPLSQARIQHLLDTGKPLRN